MPTYVTEEPLGPGATLIFGGGLYENISASRVGCVGLGGKEKGGGGSKRSRDGVLPGFDRVEIGCMSCKFVVTYVRSWTLEIWIYLIAHVKWCDEFPSLAYCEWMGCYDSRKKRSSLTKEVATELLKVGFWNQMGKELWHEMQEGEVMLEEQQTLDPCPFRSSGAHACEN